MWNTLMCLHMPLHTANTHGRILRAFQKFVARHSWSQGMYTIFWHFQHRFLQVKRTWSGNCWSCCFSQPSAVQTTSTPSKLPPHGEPGPDLTHGSLGPHPKQHLDLFSRFCTAQDCDRPTDRPRYSSVTIGHIYIVVRCGLIITCAIL